MVTSCTSPLSTDAQKSLKSTSGSLLFCLVKTLKSRRNISPRTSHRARFLVVWFNRTPSGRNPRMERYLIEIYHRQRFRSTYLAQRKHQYFQGVSVASTRRGVQPVPARSLLPLAPPLQARSGHNGESIELPLRPPVWEGSGAPREESSFR